MEFLFTVPVGMPCWVLVEHDLLIIAVFIPIVSRRKWKGSWTIQGIGWRRGIVRDFKLECKREWGQTGPVPTEGNLRQVS